MGQISIARGVVAIDPTSAPGVPLYTDVTSPQVLYSGTSGLISGSAKFQWINSTSSLEFGTGAEIYLYNTADQTTDYERGVAKWDTNAYVIGTEKGGTGSARTLNFQVDGTSRWYITTAGHFLTTSSNGYDIGASGSLVRSLYYGTNLDGASGATFNLYNTADQTTNYERLRADWSGSVARILTQFGGSASARILRLGVSVTGAAPDTYVDIRGSSPFLNYVTPTTSQSVGNQWSGSFTANSGTQTALSIVNSFNQSGTAGYTALDVNPTETATGSGTKLLQRWAVGGISRAQMDSGGAFWSTIIVSTGGVQLGTTLGTAGDVHLNRDAADTLALRRDTNQQIFRVYNTYTDASNYERLAFAWGSNIATISTDAAGTGTVRWLRLNGATLSLMSGGTQRWNVNSSGHFLAEADNTYDIGASGANRPRNIYVGSGIVAGGVISTTNYTSALYSIITDGVTAPAATAGQAKLYVDSADGDLKVIFGDGAIKTIVTDT